MMSGRGWQIRTRVMVMVMVMDTGRRVGNVDLIQVRGVSVPDRNVD